MASDHFFRARGAWSQRPAMLLPGILALLLAVPNVARAAELEAGASEAVRVAFAHGGRERAYFLWAPTGERAGRVPLVLVLHGGGGNGENVQEMTGFTAVARREGFAVAYPEGTGRLGRLLTWNAGHCCGYAMSEGVDDVGFLTALVERLVADGLVDPARVYVTGMSNGAMMAHRMGAEASAHVAAIAPVVGGLFGDERRPSVPVSALLINGALDRSIPVDGGQTGGRFANAWDGTPLRPVAFQGDFWASANGCRDAGREVVRGVVRERTAICPPGVAVRSLLLHDNGHAWPGGQPGSARGDVPSTAIDATEVIWAFFLAHPRGLPIPGDGCARPSVRQRMAAGMRAAAEAGAGSTAGSAGQAQVRAASGVRSQGP